MMRWHRCEPEMEGIFWAWFDGMTKWKRFIKKVKWRITPNLLNHTEDFEIFISDMDYRHLKALLRCYFRKDEE